MRRLIAAEFLKLRLTSTTWKILGIGILLPVIILLLVPVKDVHTSKDVVKLLGWAGATGYITLILGAIGATTEYRYRTIVPTLLVAPHRLKVLHAQIIAYIVAALGVAVVSILIVTALTAMRTGLHDTSTSTLIGSYLGSIAYIVLSTLFGLGIGILVKNQAATIATIFVLFMLLGHALPVLSPSLSKYTLDSIGTSLSGGGGLPQEKGSSPRTLLSSRSAGLAYSVYMAVPLVLGFVRFRKSDIT